MLGLHHPLLGSIRKAIHRGSRTEDGFAVAEGFHFLQEAIRVNAPIAAILATPRAASQLEHLAHVHLIDENLLQQISTVENSQGVISLIEINARPVTECFGANPLVIGLDGIQDPGNAGAIVRSAEAFGATGVVFLKGSVSPWNPKTLRASAGSLLRLPFAVCDWAEFHNEVKQRSISLYAAHPRAEKRIGDVRLNEPAAILIGNEGRGLPEEHQRLAVAVRIPTAGVESLNAALAAGIMLYEAQRQRQ